MNLRKVCLTYCRNFWHLSIFRRLSDIYRILFPFVRLSGFGALVFTLLKVLLLSLTIVSICWLVGWSVRRRSVCHDFLKSQGSSTSKFLSGRLFRKGQFQNGERWRPPSPSGLLQNTTPYNKVLTLGMKRFWHIILSVRPSVRSVCNFSR